MKGVNDDEILDFVQLTENQNIHVRFIEYMPFGGNKWNSKKLVTYRELVEKIETRYPNFEELKTDFNETSKVIRNSFSLSQIITNAIDKFYFP